MVLILPLGVDYRAQRYPMVTFSLIGINTLIWLVTLIYSLAGGEDADETIRQNFWLIPQASLWHTYVTTMFVHEGFFHLLGNMIYLFLFGACVEDIMGRWQFGVFYLLGGLAAVFGHIIAVPGHFSFRGCK